MLNNTDEKEELQYIDDELKYVDITDIIQKKHEKYGNAAKKNKHLQILENDMLNKLCRYCWQEIYTKEHKKTCLYIPVWIKDKKVERLTIKSFDGYWFKHSK